MTLIKVNNRGQQNNLGRRNLIINGDMKVAQRNGTAVTQAPHSGYAGPDRWKTFASGGGAYTITQDSGHQADTGHDKALKIAVTTADTSIAAGDVYSFLTRIESNSLQHLQYGTSSAKSLTFSFWVRATKTGTQAVFFSKQGTGTDYNHIKEFTINASNTWEHKTITIPGLTASTMINDASTYIQAGWILKYGSAYHGTKDSWRTDSDFTTSAAVNNMDSTSNTFYVTGVQLEVGDRATDFEHRSLAEELALCQRYFIKSGNAATGTDEWFPGVTTDGAKGRRLAQAFDGNQDRAGALVEFPTYMRSSPTIVFYPGRNDVAQTVGSIAVYNGATLVTTSGKPVGRANGLQGYFSGTSTDAAAYAFQFTADAEL